MLAGHVGGSGVPSFDRMSARPGTAPPPRSPGLSCTEAAGGGPSRDAAAPARLLLLPPVEGVSRQRQLLEELWGAVGVAEDAGVTVGRSRLEGAPTQDGAAASTPDAEDALIRVVAAGALVWPRGAAFTWQPGGRGGRCHPGRPASAAARTGAPAHAASSEAAAKPTAAAAASATAAAAARPATAAPAVGAGLRATHTTTRVQPGASAAWAKVAGSERPSAAEARQQRPHSDASFSHTRTPGRAAAGSATGDVLATGPAPAAAAVCTGGLAPRVKGGAFNPLTCVAAPSGGSAAPPSAADPRTCDTEMAYSPNHGALGHVRRAPAWKLPPNQPAVSQRLARRATAAVLRMPVESAELGGAAGRVAG